MGVPKRFSLAYCTNLNSFYFAFEQIKILRNVNQVKDIDGVLVLSHRDQNSPKRCYSTGTPPTLQKSEADTNTPVNAEELSLQHPDYFGVHDLVSVRDLFKARVHFGHKEGLRNRYMTPYIFGNRLGIDIFDLDQTLTLFQDALNITAHTAYRGGVILFLSRHRETSPLVERVALESGEYSHCRYWKGGTFTNSTVQFNTVTRLPDLCIFLSTNNSVFNQHKAIIDCAKLLIPTIGVVDSNSDPRLITYPVPGNDDTPASVQYYCDVFKEAILRGKAKRKEDGLDADDAV